LTAQNETDVLELICVKAVASSLGYPSQILRFRDKATIALRHAGLGMVMAGHNAVFPAPQVWL